MKNNIFGSNNSNNSSNNSRGKKPKFSILWMYVIIMAVILGIYWSNDMSTSRDVSWTQFQGYVEEGAVDSIVVFSNKQEANAYINDSLAKVIFKTAFLPRSTHAPTSQPTSPRARNLTTTSRSGTPTGRSRATCAMRPPATSAAGFGALDPSSCSSSSGSG